MRAFLDFFRSIVFNIVFYTWTVLLCGLYVMPIALLFGEKAARHGIGVFCNTHTFFARWIMGIRVEYRGVDQLPKDEAVILAAAHQSYMDPILTYRVRSDVTALAKKELMDMPIIGPILKTIGAVRVDRKAGDAHKVMADVGDRMRAEKRALIVYPQATRVRPGARKRLKSGAYHMARDAALPVYTVASTIGLFWTNGFFHRSGKAVFEVRGPYTAGDDKDAFMAIMDADVVLRSEEIAQETGCGAYLAAPGSAAPGQPLLPDGSLGQKSSD